MIDLIALEDQLIHNGLVQDRIHYQMKSFLVLVLFDILETPCGKIIHHKYLFAHLKKPVYQVRTYKPCTARDQDLHYKCLKGAKV
jgi:hypothetical protein